MPETVEQFIARKDTDEVQWHKDHPPPPLVMPVPYTDEELDAYERLYFGTEDGFMRSLDPKDEITRLWVNIAKLRPDWRTPPRW